MPFADIPGNDKIKEILRSALRRDREQGRPVIFPSLLFAGAKSAGQRQTALELAKALNCETQSDDACGVCDSCRRIDGGVHPDVIDVINLPRKLKKSANNDRSEDEEPAGNETGLNDADDKSDELGPKPTNIVIEQMRWAIKYALMKPMIGRKRFFLIDDATEMEEEAANASLKILEEPPDFTQFILIASNAERLLPTIISRCQELSFGPIPFDDLVSVLRGRGFGATEARTGARIARGDYQKARTMEWEDVREERDRDWELFRLVMAGKEPSGFLRAFGSTGKSRRKSEESEQEWMTMLEMFGEFSRDLLLIAETGGTDGLFNPDFADGLRELAPAVGSERALRAVRAVDTAIEATDKFLNRRLQASVLFARMTG